METQFTVERIERVTAVTFVTQSLMNQSELDRIGLALEALVNGGARAIVLDFSAVQFLSSLGIRMILALQQKLKKAGGKGLCVCGISPQLAELLRITRLDKVLKVASSRADAIRSSQ
jgi:anti-sigma B factor antagonist